MSIVEPPGLLVGARTSGLPYTHPIVRPESGGNIFKGGRTSRSPEGGTSPTYCLDTVTTSLPLVRCVMEALTMSPTPAVVSSKSRASTSGFAAQRIDRDQRVLREGSGRLDRVRVDAVAHLERVGGVAARAELLDGAAHVAAERTRLLPGKVSGDELIVDRVDRGARDLDEDLARRRFRHRGVVDHRQHVWRRRIAVLMLESGLHGFVLDATLNI